MGGAGGGVCVSVCLCGAACLPPGPAQPRGETVKAPPFELFYRKQNGRVGRPLTAQEKNIFSLKKMRKKSHFFLSRNLGHSQGDAPKEAWCSKAILPAVTRDRRSPPVPG